jgi:alpha-mannosidase
MSKTIHMIGNSHIDPVWFWKMNEGLQEVKATFSSALDRMNEYPDFKFTASSIFFYEWIEKIAPLMFEQIKQRVLEGRWEIVGGWYVEPDCNMPAGEAFVRQGLYSQRYLREKFGKVVKIGFNIDSFGHNSMLPQILKKSGIDFYIFMRPQNKELPPLFKWTSIDGSQVITCKLPGEYTTWFEESTLKNIEITLEKMEGFAEMPCFYGVGNHGGGPTKANIETIQRFIGTRDGVDAGFSSLEYFFSRIRTNELITVKDEMERLSVGCYSVDSEIKSLNRRGENAVIRAEKLVSLAYILGNEIEDFRGSFKGIWNLINFNQFHDTLAGTSIMEARNEAVMQFSKAITDSVWIENLAIQSIINSIYTNGDGHPLIIFNPNSRELDTYFEVELNWFCKAPLKITDIDGNEITYQRIKTSATMINRVLGGRRRVIFKGIIPPFGYKIFRLHEEESSESTAIDIFEDNYLLENEVLRVEFNRSTGLLSKIIEKKTGYNVLKKDVSHRVFTDKRDTWGGGTSTYEYSGRGFVLREIKKVEEGVLRSTIRAIYTYENSVIEQHYQLYKDNDYIIVKNHLTWNEKHKLLKLTFPIAVEKPVVRAEIPYGFIDREFLSGEEDFMHSWVNVYDKEKGKGALIINDSKYGYSMEESSYSITVARSPIFAQGNCEGWYNENDTYRFADQGEQDFTIIIKPHAERCSNFEAISLSHLLNVGYEYIADSKHYGRISNQIDSFIKISKANIVLSAIKRAEDDSDIILRLYETEGEDTDVEVRTPYCSKAINISFRPCEIKTIKVSKTDYREVNLLEFGGTNE